MTEYRLRAASIGFLLLMAGCSKSEKDFAGTYRTFYATKVEITDAFGEMERAFHLKPSGKTSGRSFNDLGEIKVELFVDPQKKALSGEAVFYLKTVDNTSVKPEETTKQFDLDVSNFRLNGDTLEFSLDNQLFKNTGRRIIGKIVKGGDANVLGIGKEMVTFPAMATSPFFVRQLGPTVYYNCYNEEITKSKVRSFFTEQETRFVKEIESEKSPRAKQFLENSLADVRARLK